MLDLQLSPGVAEAVAGLGTQPPDSIIGPLTVALFDVALEPSVFGAQEQALSVGAPFETIQHGRTEKGMLRFLMG